MAAFRRVCFVSGAPVRTMVRREAIVLRLGAVERFPEAALWLNGMVELRCVGGEFRSPGNPLNPFGASQRGVSPEETFHP